MMGDREIFTESEVANGIVIRPPTDLSRANSADSQKSRGRSSKTGTRKSRSLTSSEKAAMGTPPVILLKNQFNTFTPKPEITKKIKAISNIINRDTDFIERMYLLNQISNKLAKEKKELGLISALKIIDKLEQHFGPRNTWFLSYTPFIVDLIGSTFGIVSTIDMMKKYIKMICKMRNSIIRKLRLDPKQISDLNKAFKIMVKDVITELFNETPHIVSHITPDGKKFVIDRVLDTIFLTDEFCGRP